MAYAMWEFISVFVLSLLLAYPLGAYLADVMQAKPMKSDRFFKWIEQFKNCSHTPQRRDARI